MKQEIEDRIMRAFLREVVGGETPPDLTARIVQSIENSSAHDSSTENATRAGSFADPQGAAAQPAPIAIPASPERRHPGRRWQVLVSLALGLLLLGVAGRAVWPPHQAGETKLASRTESPVPSMDLEGPANTTAEVVAAPRSSAPEHQRSPHDGDVASQSSQKYPQATAPEATSPEAAEPEATGPPQVTEMASQQQVLERINQELEAMWVAHSVTPSSVAADSAWCRRVYLRLLGRVPTVAELKTFLSANENVRRGELVDRILNDSKYQSELAQHWAVVWTNVLIGRSKGLQDNELASRESLELFLRSEFEAQRPFDQVAFDLIVAVGGARQSDPNFNGAVNFLLAHHDPKGIQATARVSQVFLGQQRQCVQCHDHPTRDVNQKEFWELNAFFRQMSVNRGQDGVRLENRDFLGESKGSRDGEIFYEQMNGQVKVAFPILPNGEALPRSGLLKQVNRRELLADWICQSDEFARAIVNRVWSHYLGYGLVEPIDDLGPHNPPSHPRILTVLAQQFQAHEYDLRKLTHWILLSEAFQRSSEVSDANLADAPDAGSTPLFSKYYTRQLAPEAVYKSLMLVANFREKTQGLDATQAKQAWMNQFTRRMGNDDGGEIIDFDGGVQQSLIMMNSPLTQLAIRQDHHGVLGQVIASPMSSQEKVTHLFLAAISRNPTRREMTVIERMLKEHPEKQASTLQDVWWALLNSNEFILDH